MKDATKLFKGTPVGCYHVQGINDPLLSVEEFEKKDNCQLRESVATLLHDDTHSCYAEVAIDYATQNMIFQLDQVTNANEKLFSDVSGNGKKVVVQYEIKGDFDTNALGMVTRIQCDTKDNCALEELIKLLPNLVKHEARVKVFEKINVLLNEGEQTQGLMCLNSESATDFTCLNGAKYCVYEFKLDSEPEKNCKLIDFTNDVKYELGIDFIPDYDIKYRYSELLKHDESVTLDEKAHFAFVFECKIDRCNNDETAKQVEALLSFFVKNPTVEPTKIATDKRQDQYKSPISQGKAKKNRSNSLVSYQSMIIFTLFSCFSI